jgi:tRNA threonylcarbamoyladenosine biosynthesis protein TsaE
MEMVKFLSSGEEWTVRFGRRLGALAQPGDWLGLAGELGAGKTRLVQGLARGLGVDPAIPVTSPTFVLLQSYAGRLPLHHLDLYRLRAYEELVEIGYPELVEGSGVCVVEWWDRVEESRGERGLSIEFSILDERRRELALRPIGRRGRELLEALAQTSKAGGER